MKISNVMTKKPITLDEKATVLEAVNKMQSGGCGILPVGNDNKHIKGVVTDRDIMIRAVAKNKDLNNTPITEIMTQDVVFCDEDEFLQQAVQRMIQRNMRRILVRDKSQRLCGILSLDDIIRRVHDKSLLASLFKETAVAEGSYTQTQYKELIDDTSIVLNELKSSLPELMTAFEGMVNASSRDGALSSKVKELIALALGVSGHCPGCIGFHMKKLLKLGVTKEELLEMISVAVYMGGGPSLMYATEVLKAFHELSQS